MRDAFNCREGAVVNLLSSAYLIKLDYLHMLWIFEIAKRRIDEGQVTILADA